MKRCRLKVFFFPIFSSGGHFIKSNETIFAVLAEGYQGPLNYLKIGPLACKDMQDVLI